MLVYCNCHEKGVVTPDKYRIDASLCGQHIKTFEDVDLPLIIEEIKAEATEGEREKMSFDYPEKIWTRISKKERLAIMKPIEDTENFLIF